MALMTYLLFLNRCSQRLPSRGTSCLADNNVQTKIQSVDGVLGEMDRMQKNK
jgi:hypothetical protein